METLLLLLLLLLLLASAAGRDLVPEPSGLLLEFFGFKAGAPGTSSQSTLLGTRLSGREGGVGGRKRVSWV